jgi:hypothetical protein
MTATGVPENIALTVTGPPQWGGELELREPPGPEADLLVMDQ